MVVESNGFCIVGAKVEVIAGQAIGQSATQDEPCDVWWIGGVSFRDLTPGVEMTLRASAPGYGTQEKAFIPTQGSQQAKVFWLFRNQAP
jgi:hypothetical protein